MYTAQDIAEGWEFKILRANTRVPDTMMGDLMAQVAANRVAERLLTEFLERERLPGLGALARAIKDRSEQAVRDAVKSLPAGSCSGSVTMDGLTEPLTIRCRVDVRHDPPGVLVPGQPCADQPGVAGGDRSGRDCAGVRGF